MYGPAGFEDFSDEDDFDFSDFRDSPSSNYKQSSNPVNKSAPARTESSPRQNFNHHNGASRNGFGRGRGGFGLPPKQNQNSAGRGQRSPFAKKTHDKPKRRDPGPNPILLEDLKIAATNDDAETVVKLIEGGIAVEQVLPMGWTALMHAARNGSDRVVEALLDRGANANYQKDMYTVLMAVCDCDALVDEDKVLHCVDMLLEHGAKTGVYDRHRMSPLIYAARKGRVMICERLLEKGAQINKSDARGWTALSWAASRGYGRLIRVLLDNKADPKVYTLDGQSPSDIAYSNDHHVVSSVLEAAESGTLGNRAETILSSYEDPKEDNSSNTLERYGELEIFLCGLQLGHLVPKFQEHKITFQGFAKMTESDLDKIGISQVGVKQKIIEAIRDIHLKDWDMSSLERHQNNTMSAQEVNTVIANIGKHLSVLESSVVYARKQLEGVVEHTEFVQDVAHAEGMVLFAKEAIKNVDSLREEMEVLQAKCNELSSQTHLLSADLISPASQPHSTSRRNLLLLGLASFTAGMYFVRKYGLSLPTS